MRLEAYTSDYITYSISYWKEANVHANPCKLSRVVLDSRITVYGDTVVRVLCVSDTLVITQVAYADMTKAVLKYPVIKAFPPLAVMQAIPGVSQPTQLDTSNQNKYMQFIL